MLERYFSAPKMLGHLRAGPSGPYTDGFAAALHSDGYRCATAVRYIRAAVHLGHVLEKHGGDLADIDISKFDRHLQSCRCPRSKGGRRNHHTLYGAKRFRDYLVRVGVCQRPDLQVTEKVEPQLVIGFRHWLRKHRGAAEHTIRLYCRDSSRFVITLGDAPSCWDARRVRKYFLDRSDQCGAGSIEKLITSLRVFLRYLSAQGLCKADLDKAVPAYASWRLAELPKYLSAEQVNALIAACDGNSPARRRDRAILLLLSRLGLRAGDVARLRLSDIEWQAGALRVSGKGGYQVRLPLPQEVGDAIIDYVRCRPAVQGNDYVFLRSIAPFRPLACGDAVSCVVRRAMKRAGVVSPAKGAHVLRHTAATEMLRQGVPLDRIGLVLRHRGIDTTAYYAKADVNLLKQVAQPWPEVLS
jgi:site-specific recombinase XerD